MLTWQKKKKLSAIMGKKKTRARVRTCAPMELIGSYTGPGLPEKGVDFECSFEMNICT